MDEEIRKAVVRLDAASIEMKAAIDAINAIWNRTGKGGAALSAVEIEACRAAGRRARRAAG